MERKRWTTDEIAVLREYYPYEGEAVFKRLPGRTKKSCRIQASKLDIAKKKIVDEPVEVQPILGEEALYIKLWSKSEDEILKQYYPYEGGNVCKRLPDRDAGACRGRASKLGLSYLDGDRKWSVQEDEILKKYYPSEGSSVAERLSDRTPAACINRARRLNIQVKQKWTKEEEDIISKFYPAEGIKAFERLPGRSIEACLKKAKNMNVASGKQTGRWTEKEIEILKKYYPSKGFGYVHELLPNRSEQACRHKALQLDICAKREEIRWTKKEKQILKRYYHCEGGDVCKRLPGRSRNACVGMAKRLQLRYDDNFYHGPEPDNWIVTAIKNSTVKTRQSIIESEIKIELPGNSIITIMATCRDQKEGYVKMYTSDFDKNDGSINVEKIAGKLGASIEEDKAFIICQEKEAANYVLHLLEMCMFCSLLAA